MIDSRLENKRLSFGKALEPTNFKEQKIECCAECDYWRGTCVLNINAAAHGYLYKASNDPCLEGTPRVSRTIPLSFPR